MKSEDNSKNIDKNQARIVETESSSDSWRDNPINLTELDLSGLTLYSPIAGEIELSQIISNDKCLICQPHNTKNAIKFDYHGRLWTFTNGEIMLWPSKELYSAFPTDAHSAWLVWIDKSALTRLEVKFCLTQYKKTYETKYIDTYDDWKSAAQAVTAAMQTMRTEKFLDDKHLRELSELKED